MTLWPLPPGHVCHRPRLDSAGRKQVASAKRKGVSPTRVEVTQPPSWASGVRHPEGQGPYVTPPRPGGDSPALEHEAGEAQEKCRALPTHSSFSQSSLKAQRDPGWKRSFLVLSRAQQGPEGLGRPRPGGPACCTMGAVAVAGPHCILSGCSWGAWYCRKVVPAGAVADSVGGTVAG
jgi:hypothetical protein